MTDAYYLPQDAAPTATGSVARFAPTRATESPWDTAAQHGGPPAALLAQAIDDVVDGAAPGRMRLARISLEFLGPIPRQEVTVEVTPVKPGRRVTLTDATMSAGGRTVVLARAWHIATGPTPPAAGPSSSVPPLPDASDQTYFTGLAEWGYGESIEWRFVRGGFADLGPADVWTRVRIPLVLGRPLTGLQRTLIVADSANGLSAELPMDEWFSIPPTMTTSLLRHPAGDWVHLAAQTYLASDGLGITHADLSDADGRVGEVAQPLLVAVR